MKELSLQQMEKINGGSEWKSFVDGACIIVAFLPPVGTAVCTVWGAGRIFELW